MLSMNCGDLVDTLTQEKDFARIQSELDALLRHISSQSLELLIRYKHDSIDSCYNKSAINLIHYLALRRIDIRDLQNKLADAGLSSLGRCEAHVVDSISNLLDILSIITKISNKFGDTFQAQSLYPNQNEGRELLVRHTNLLFGEKQCTSKNRIMVTLPSQAGEDTALIRQLIDNGMDCARINCAHDNKQTWLQMVETVQSTVLETRQACKIVMDLAGPKLRTGPMPTQDTILHIRVKANRYGERISPTKILLTSSVQGNAVKNNNEPPFTYELPINSHIQNQFRAGDKLRFTDTRGKIRFIDIVEKLQDGQWLAYCAKSTFISTETVFFLIRNDNKGKPLCVGIDFTMPLPKQSIEFRLFQGDRLHISKYADKIAPPVLNSSGRIVSPGTIALSHPEILEKLDVGQQIWIDDGKMGGTVIESDSEGVSIKINHCQPKGSRVAADKGINLPDTKLAIPSITEKDKDDLAFICQHADIVSLSFTEKKKDIEELVKLIHHLTARKIGLILKIETRRGVENLPEIIFGAMNCGLPFGIMIARGDLAVELGGERMAEIQEEILWLCEAAHIPVIWATQVLESLVKKGTVSRPEMTDAAMSGRAECVMLNKGPNIVAALTTLNDILNRMQAHRYKKSDRFRALHW